MILVLMVVVVLLEVVLGEGSGFYGDDGITNE